jgi:tetrahydromethanopterin S-methyltransferase subunit C
MRKEAMVLGLRSLNILASCVVGVPSWWIWLSKFSASPHRDPETAVFIVLLAPMIGLHLPLLFYLLRRNRFQAAFWNIACAPIVSVFNFLLCLVVTLFVRESSIAVVIVALIWLFPFVRITFIDEKNVNPS